MDRTCNEYFDEDIIIDAAMIEQFDKINMNIFNNNFAYNEVIKTKKNIDISKLFDQTSYKYMINTSINNVISKLFTDIRMNNYLMKNMSTEIIYLLNLSTASYKKLAEYIYTLYICKYLSWCGAKRCVNIMDIDYSNISILLNLKFNNSIDDGLRSSEVIDSYLGFNKDILLKKYYYKIIKELNLIEKNIMNGAYRSSEVFISELQSIIINILHSNAQFIIELNNYFSSNVPIFYINDRMISYYYGDTQMNYIGQFLNYIAPVSKKAKIQNLLNKEHIHYYMNIKERIMSQTNNEVYLIDV